MDNYINEDNDKPFICDICKRGFKSKRALSQHKRFHNDEYRNLITKTFGQCWKGKHLSKETKAKIAKAHTGVKLSKEHVDAMLKSREAFFANEDNRKAWSQRIKKIYAERPTLRKNAIETLRKGTTSRHDQYRRDLFGDEFADIYSSKEKVISEINKLQKELGHKPSYHELANHFDVPWNFTYNMIQKHDLQDMIFRPKSHSNLEIDVLKYAQTFDENAHHERKVIWPRYLDIYSKTKSFAIEVNGIFFHSIQNVNDGRDDKWYELDKTKRCSAKNIQLIHIWEDEWNDRQDDMKSIIKAYMTEGFEERAKLLYDLGFAIHVDDTIRVDLAKVDLKEWLQHGFRVISIFEPITIKRGKYDCYNCGYAFIAK